MIDTDKYRTTIAHTQTAKDGSFVVITDVPAYVFEEDGVEDSVYDMDVALKIDDFIARHIKSNFGVRRDLLISFNELDFNSNNDAEFHIRGSGVNYGEATTKIWKESVDKIHGSIDILRKAYAVVFPKTHFSFPVFTGVGAGSLKFALRARAPSELFSDYRDKSSPEVKVLQLLFDGYSYVHDAKSENQLIEKHSEIAFAVLEAIERLSPSEGSSIREIQLVPNEKVIKESHTVQLTAETQQRAKWKRETLQNKLNDLEVRQMVIVGKVHSLSKDGQLLIKEIEYNHPGVKKYNTSATFDSRMFRGIGQLFTLEKKITFRGVERKLNGVWANPEITSVEEAPSKEEEAD